MRKKNEFKPVKLGFNTIEETAYKKQLKDKQHAFNNIIGFCYRHLKELEQQQLYNEPYEHFKERIMDVNKDLFKGISFERIAFLKEIELSEYKEMVHRFESIEIELDAMTLEPTEEADFNIYSINEEENSLYYALQQSVKGFNLYKSILPSAQLTYLLTGITFDHVSKTYKVDTRNIIYSRRERGL